MSEHPFEPEVPSIDQVVDLLEAYADARLAPRGAVLARMRRNVIAELDARTALLEAERAARHAKPQQTWWRMVHLRVPRGIAAAGMAATLTFATSAAVFAAPPGSPFYNARVALEQVFLPAETDDRVAAHERHLQDRLAEAQAAANRGDLVALEAALAAYRAEVDVAVADVGSDPELLAHLEAELAKHTAILESLAAQLPEQVAIEHAIEVSQKAAKKLHDTGKPANPGQPVRPTPPTAPNSR
jgi:hypothetical protein